MDASHECELFSSVSIKFVKLTPAVSDMIIKGHIELLLSRDAHPGLTHLVNKATRIFNDPVDSN